MIQLILAVAIFIGTAYAVVGILQDIARRTHRYVILFVLSILMVAAGFVGFVCSHTTYSVGDQVRIQGIPIPLVVFRLETDRWTDFIQPVAIGYLAYAANIIAPAFICLLLARFALRITKRGR